MNLSAEIPISRTKIIVPERRSDFLSRKRLLALMYQLLDKKLTLISAPAGYGKTSALIDFSYESDLPVCWLSLDTLDTDPQRFIGYFIAALSQRFPKFGGQAKALLSEITSFEPKQMEGLVVTLVNDLYEHAREHFIVILDDYHLVDYAEEIQHFINRFVQLVDENCHLIISSRALIPIPDLPLMVARQQVDGLSNLELAFQADEIQALFEKNYQTSLSKTAAQALEKESEGWITGLQLSSMTTHQGVTDLPRITRTSGVGLFEYFGHQILDRQTKEMRDFLLQSSLLGEFDVEFCETILSNFSPKPRVYAELINTILQKNLFALPVGTDGKWTRYHHLFQDFLQTILNEEDPNLVEAIYYRMAEVHAERGEWEKAYHFYLQLEDFEQLGKLVVKAGTPLLQNGRLLTLKSWLANIPERLRRSHPGVLSLEGLVICMLGNVTDGLSLLNQAEVSFRTSGDTNGLAHALVRRTTPYRFLGNYSASLMDAEEALILTNEKNDNVDVNLEALRSKGLSLYHLGQGSDAVEWLTRALDGFTQIKKSPNILIVLTELGMVYQAIGDIESAQVSYEKAFSIGQETGNLAWKANLLNNLGVLYHLQAKYEKAVQIFEDGLDIAQRSGHIRVEVALLVSLGDLYADLDEIEAAQQSYHQAKEIIDPANDKFLYHYLKLAEASIARSKEEYSQAHQLLTSAQKQIQDTDSSYEQGLFHLERGRLAVTEEDIPQALINLRAAKRYFKQDGRTMEYSWSQLWLSSAAYQSGDIEVAREELDEVIALSKEKSIVHTIGSQARQVKPWLEGMQKDPIIGTSLSAFMDEVAVNEAQLPATRRSLRRIVSAVPMSLPRITILALGRGQVKINGKTITPSDWKTQSVRDLFFYFLTTSQEKTKEQIGLVFWPDIDPAKLKMRFKNVLYRLRRALGPKAILFENDRYSFNHALDYDYDVETFVTHLAQAINSSDIQEQIKHYQTAVDLVRGPYLSDIHMNWILPEREHLSQLYISSLLKLSKLYLENKAPDMAIITCQKILKQDTCHEEAHRLLMKAFAILGDRSAIARQYKECKQALKEELDIPPAEETENLYRQLIA